MVCFRGLWEPGVQYNIGDEAEFEGCKYSIIQAHRSQGDWTPPVTPALWGRMEGCPPVGEHSYCSPDQSAKLPTYDGYQQQTPPPQQDQPKPQPAQPYTAPGGVQVEEHETQKKWYDLDKSKKELLLGGGLALGLGLLGAGYYSHEKHKKANEEEHQAQAWELQNWVMASRQRTEEFFRNGPRAPTTWVFSEALAQHRELQRDFIVGGEEEGVKLFIARAPHEGSIQVGKYKAGDKYATMGYGHDEVKVSTFEVLIGMHSGVRWVRAKGKLEMSELNGARPVEGGHEENGTPLFIARGEYKGNVIPGKASSKLSGAFVPFDDDEKEIKEYEVLCYA